MVLQNCHVPRLTAGRRRPILASASSPGTADPATDKMVAHLSGERVAVFEPSGKPADFTLAAGGQYVLGINTPGLPTISSLLTEGPLPVTAPLVLNPLMARIVEAAGLPSSRMAG